ncbi:MAG: DUF3574 domain-containing protein [Verrucomicrobiota bacterium]
MRCWSLLIGARNVGAKRGRFTRADDDLIQKLTASHFPKGFTILRADGGWHDPAQGRFIREECRQILICDSRPAIIRWGKALGRALRQKELVLIQGGRALQLKVRVQ